MIVKKLVYIFLLIILLAPLYAQRKKKAPRNIPPKSISLEIAASIRIDSLFNTEPIFSGDRIYSFAKPFKIRCTDIRNNILWQTELAGEMKFNPVLRGNELAVVSAGGDLIVLDASSGKQIQSLGLEDPLSAEITGLNYSGKISLMIPKMNDSNAALLLSSVSGKISCLDLETLQEHWKNNDLKDSIQSKAILVKDKIITSGKDGFVVCLDARSGLLIWRWKESEISDFSKSSFISDGRNIYLTSADSILYSIDLLLGKMNWKLPEKKMHPEVLLSDDGKRLTAYMPQSKIFFLSAKEGKITKELKLKELAGRALQKIIQVGGSIIFAKEDLILGIDSNYSLKGLAAVGEKITAMGKVDKNRFYTLTGSGKYTLYKLR